MSDAAITRGRAQDSTDKHEWRTPGQVYTALDHVFRFVLDAAATEHNALAAQWLDKEHDCLHPDPWTHGLGSDMFGTRMEPLPPEGAVWMNPPWGAPGRPKGSGFPGTGAFVERAWRAAKNTGRFVVVLIPSSTDAVWWRDGFRQADTVLLMRRVAFLTPAGVAMKSPPGAPCVMIFDPKVDDTTGTRVKLWHVGEPVPWRRRRSLG